MDHEELNMEEALDLDEIKRIIDMDVAEPEPEPNMDPQAQTAPESAPAPEPEKPASDAAAKNGKTDPQKSIVLYLHDLVIMMAGIVLVFLLCFRIVVVSGSSMYDTLVDGDYLLLLGNVFYSEPKVGDIIVASKESYDDGKPIIKRVIATEGQVVDIDFSTGTVKVDGVVIEEDYIYSPTTNPEGVSFPLTVSEGCVFVLGDNRIKSKDSRNPEIGLIDTREIVGKAIFLLFPGVDQASGEGQPQFDRIGVIG